MTLRDDSIVLATHVFADGASQACHRYLLKRGVRELLWITHPLFPRDNPKGSGWTLHRAGREVDSLFFPRIRMPEPALYALSLFLSVAFVLLRQRRYDLFVGFNNLNALAGLILRRLGVVRRCVYHVTDFVPRRFENTLLNTLYHRIESYCACHCDETWNLSRRMVAARERYKGLKESDCGPQREVPIGVWTEEQVIVPWEAVRKRQLVFMGHLLEKQGVQHVLRAMPLILAELPDVNLLILGKGEYAPALQALATELGIGGQVEFRGFVPDHRDLERMIAESALAVALYEPGDLERNWTYYTDAGKIKAYLGAGVPVLTTSVPTNAGDIAFHECGLLVDPQPAYIGRAVVGLLGDPERLQRYRHNALDYARRFDWNAIFDPLFT